MAERKVGRVTHYFSRIGVAALRLEGPVTLGERLHFLGHGADFYQQVTSMQIEGKPVERAQAGQEVGIKVDSPVREGTEVYLVES